MLSGLFADLSPRSPLFSPNPIRVHFVLDRLPLGQISVLPL